MTERNQSRGEELANTISHGMAATAAIVGAPFLIVSTVKLGDPPEEIVGASIFAACMILLYLSSAIYHALPHGPKKKLFRTIEHSAIYLLIAGTYTPFTLGILHGPLGWTLFGLIWGLALIGVVLSVITRLSHPIISIALYLVMGWLVLIAIKPLVTQMATAGFLLLAGGGVAYTAGVFFYVTDDHFKYGHFIWHLFVMTGTILHYFAVLWYATGQM